MITASRALAMIIEETMPLPAEKILATEAPGRVLARDCRARDDLPRFDNSAMDGYAVKAGDLRGAKNLRPVELVMSSVIRAGSRGPKRIKPGEAARIMTGAPIPSGADSVVMQEDTATVGKDRVKFFACPERGENIRRAGEDVRRGALLLRKGGRLRPFEVALLAAQGFSLVQVRRRPKVAVLATGDELARSKTRLRAGQIRDANRPALISALLGWRVPVRDGGIVSDHPKAIERRARKLLAGADALLVSGGVSVGEFDLCRRILERMGVRRIFWKVAIKPGKPLYFGIYRGRPVFGLPGNPVSALVCLYEFVRPAIEKMSGVFPPRSRFALRGRLAHGNLNSSDRQRYLFCEAREMGGEYEIRIIRPQGAAMIRNVCRANALAVVPPGKRRWRTGETLAFRWLK